MANPPGVRPRDRILAKAIELLGTHGFDAMTMRLLGDAVGLDNSSLYRHFRSKGDLVHSALDHVSAEVLAVVAPLIDNQQPTRLQALEAICVAAGGYFFDHPSSARLMVHWIMSIGEDGPGFVVSVSAKDTSRPGGELLTRFSGWLDDGVRNGELRRHSIPDALIMITGTLLLRPATRGYFLNSLEPKRSGSAARDAWLAELRIAISGFFAP